MPAGRPTKYSEELLQKAREYLDGGYQAEEPVPTIAGLADYIDLARSTVHAWSAEGDKPEFSDIVEAVLRKQERGLIAGGLRGDYNATMAKLALSKHGYTDKVENTLQGPDGGPIDMIIEAVGNGPA